MTYLKKLLFGVGLFVCLSASSFVSAQSSPDLNLSNASLERQQAFTFNPRFTASQSGRIEDDYAPREWKPLVNRSRDKVVYSGGVSKVQVTAQNAGTKTIKAITWEYVFYSDAQMTQALQSLRIYSKKQIRAGETKVLRGNINVPADLETQYERVRPIRIEYADGTFWQAP